MSFVTCSVCRHVLHVAATRTVAGRVVCGDCCARGYGRTRRPGRKARRPRPPKKIAPTRATDLARTWTD